MFAADADIFSAEAYQTKRASMQALEVAMWDSEPDNSLLTRLQRVPKPLLLFAAAVLALGASRAVSRASLPAPAALAATAAVSSHSSADASARPSLKKATATTADAKVVMPSIPPAEHTALTTAAAADFAAPAAGVGKSSKVMVSTAGESTAAVGVQSSEGAKIHAHTPISAAQADEVVKRWLDTRGAALGQEHQKDQLHTVLQGKMLRDWKQRAQAAQDNGR